jgi:hypothetical protein
VPEIARHASPSGSLGRETREVAAAEREPRDPRARLGLEARALRVARGAGRLPGIERLHGAAQREDLRAQSPVVAHDAPFALGTGRTLAVGVEAHARLLTVRTPRRLR